MRIVDFNRKEPRVSDFALSCIFIASAVILCTTIHDLHAAERQGQSASLQSWEVTKRFQIPKNELPELYGTPYRQPIATLAWEDGVYITRDGLSLYTDYFLLDALTAMLDKAVPMKSYLYKRGPDIGQDFANPFGQPFPWIHSDIACATRTSTAQPFSRWHLVNRRSRFSNESSAQGILNQQNPARFDYFVYSGDANGHISIMLLRNTDRGLTGEGHALPQNINDRRYHEQNPHIERYDSTAPAKLVLFFDSNNWPGCLGPQHMLYALSDDAGNSWTNPKPVRSLNTAWGETQPHLYFDGIQWWLYYGSVNPADRKPAIYRARQAERNNWDSWTNKQLVVSAGRAQGVGEPTLTANGDLSFVVVTRNDHGTATDQRDCDPWFMPKLR